MLLDFKKLLWRTSEIRKAASRATLTATTGSILSFSALFTTQAKPLEAAHWFQRRSFCARGSHLSCKKSLGREKAMPIVTGTFHQSPQLWSAPTGGSTMHPVVPASTLKHLYSELSFLGVLVIGGKSRDHTNIWFRKRGACFAGTEADRTKLQGS